MSLDRKTLIGLSKMLRGGMATVRSSNGKIIVPESLKKEKLPRSVCAICGIQYDFAIIPKDSKIVPGHCSSCKSKLAEGYIAAVAIKGFTFFKMTDVELQKQYAGTVIPCSDIQFDELNKRYGGNKPENPT